MIYVESVQFYDAETGARGDCMRACTASILELELEDVPHFAAEADWFGAWTSFLAGRGWALTQWCCSSGPNEPPDRWRFEGYWLGVVKSPRIVMADGEPGSHMVVMDRREIAWDPSPARADGHLGFTDGYALVALDPARFQLREESS